MCTYTILSSLAFIPLLRLFLLLAVVLGESFSAHFFDTSHLIIWYEGFNTSICLGMPSNGSYSIRTP